MKVKIETMEDLWSLQRIIFPNDIIRGESERKFKPEEGSKGDMKKVFITLKLEKSELDKSAVRLRLAGKIMDAKPLEYVRLNSYHTINVAPGEVIEIVKERWPGYLLQVVKGAVSDTKRPRLGLIVIDEEKALPAYLLGYGVEFRSEIYAGLSKRMSQKDFTEQQNKYYEKVLALAGSMDVDTVVMAGPGFTKDDIRHWSRALGLRTWDKPAAACLASRLPYGTPVTLGRLAAVEAAESALRALGFGQLRVRHHGDAARLEVEPDALGEVVTRREEVVAAVRAAGFTFVSLDLEGFRSGSLNRVLQAAGRTEEEEP